MFQAGALRMRLQLDPQGDCELHCYNFEDGTTMVRPDGWPKSHSKLGQRKYPPELPPVLNKTTRYDDDEVEKEYRRACAATRQTAAMFSMPRLQRVG